MSRELKLEAEHQFGNLPGDFFPPHFIQWTRWTDSPKTGVNQKKQDSSE
jgi:hypothetical protein